MAVHQHDIIWNLAHALDRLKPVGHGVRTVAQFFQLQQDHLLVHCIVLGDKDTQRLGLDRFGLIRGAGVSLPGQQLRDALQEAGLFHRLDHAGINPRTPPLFTVNRLPHGCEQNDFDLGEQKVVLDRP